nr:cyclic peptide export ABC transporter [Pleionea sp. CnH1-48]
MFESFIQKAPNKVFISIVLGALAGVGYSALIPLVLMSVAPKDPAFAEVEKDVASFLSLEVAQYEIALLFFVSCILILFVRTISEVILLRVATLVSRDYRLQFYKQITEAPISAIEKIGSSKLIASINLDVPRVVMGARVFPALLVNGVSLMGMLGFLLYLNASVFKLVILSIICGVIAYQIPMIFGRKIFTRARHIRDDLQEGIRGLVYGAKELKINDEKKKAFFEEVLIQHENDILKNEKTAHTIVNATASFGELLSFFVIGLVSFVFVNYHAITQEELVGVIMALLYLIGPMAIILNSIPQLTVAFVSVRKINQLLKEIPQEEVSLEVGASPAWSQVSFDDVVFRYDAKEDESGFGIGPVNFTLNKGEVTFIIGANGSGKSTLSKLITLHYLPVSGNIKFGDEALNAETTATLRQNISAIFSDYFLFDRLLIALTPEMEEKAQHYLEKLHLSSKVSIKNKRFSTLSLSDGQRKRLALLVAYLEDKELYLFDEWAADQDPVFKRVFYRELLPELKQKGKAIVVISHDERYFDVADHLLIMDQGKLASKEKTEQMVNEPELLASEYC